MTFADPMWRADRIAWRFGRSGDDGQVTRRFFCFPDETKERLRVLSGLAENEIPAVATYRADTCGSVITSDRVVSFSEGAQWAVPLVEIADATVNVAHLLAAGRKDNVEVVTIVTNDGRHLDFEVEAGRPMAGVWNALKMVAGWNRRSPR